MRRRTGLWKLRRAWLTKALATASVTSTWGLKTLSLRCSDSQHLIKRQGQKICIRRLAAISDQLTKGGACGRAGTHQAAGSRLHEGTHRAGLVGDVRAAIPLEGIFLRVPLRSADGVLHIVQASLSSFC